MNNIIDRIKNNVDKIVMGKIDKDKNNIDPIK